LAHFPPADDYNVDCSVESLLKSTNNFKDKGNSNCSLVLFGHGDGGGGPEFMHLERLKRVKDFDPVPKVKFSTTKKFFEKLSQNSQ
jgi:alpha-mannosidase